MKKKTKDIAYKSLSRIKREVFRDAQVKREYENLKPRYAIIQAMLDARIHQGMTQAELARRAGTTQSAIARFESGSGNPTVDFLAKVSHALGKHLEVKVR